MHEHIAHDEYYPTFAEFVDAVLEFPRKTVPGKTRKWCNAITDNFRIISQKNDRLVG